LVPWESILGLLKSLKIRAQTNQKSARLEVT
jgi:hypothetical protein